LGKRDADVHGGSVPARPKHITALHLYRVAEDVRVGAYDDE
jgi:hypothetical protein